jgi:CMP-N-acetylneuraminic acid synthetase
MNKKVLGILPARGGSKGIVGKNLLQLAGKPLLAWAGEALLNAKSLSKCICSTDSEEIAICAKQLGLEVPFIRPQNLSDDTAKIVDVILHALNFFSDVGFNFSHVALVQATSPTIRSEDIDAAVKIAIREDADTVFSGFKATSSHPSLMYSIEENDQVSWLLKEGSHEKRRQEFQDIYIRSGLIYVIKADVIFQKNSIYGDKMCSYEIQENRAITIDEEQDLEWAKFLFKNYE